MAGAFDTPLGSGDNAVLMSADFSRTLGALRADRTSASRIAGAIAIIILTAWLVWFVRARVAVYRTSLSARIEVFPAPTRMAAPVGGRVARVSLSVGAEARAGEVLVELETTAERIALARARTAITATEAEAASVGRELSAEDTASLHAASSDREDLREVIARQRAAEAAMRLAGEEETRTRALFAAGAASESEVARAVAEHREKTAALDALVHQTQALDAVGRQRESSRKIRREQLERQHAQLEADLAYARAEVERLENELERKVIRAPVDGTLGEVASLQPGAVLAEGSVVATLIPRGELQVVAGYGADSIGRITSGQRGRLRLDGFPWTQYGTVALEVVRVASEIREQSVRVEFRIRESNIPLHHGMTGTVDVEVEQASPLVLMLRAAGKRVDESRN